MRLEKLINECAEALQERAGADYYPGCEDDTYTTTVNTDCGYIDLVYEKGDVTAWVNHDDNNHWSENLETFIAGKLCDCIDFDALEDDYADACADEYQQHGFASEADFWKWKEG